MVGFFAKNWYLDHFSIVDQILRYSADSSEKDITFRRKSKLNIIWYLDSD